MPPAGFSLDNVFADHMVLQRGKPLRFSGWADPGTRVTCSFHGRDVTAAAGADGRWLAELPPEEAGGPYDLRVTTDRSTAVRLSDILVGDVWICSGQSNMEMPADAALAPDGSVLVSSPAMEHPAEVRYAYTGFPHAPNLYRTDDDLPVYPFRRAVR